MTRSKSNADTKDRELSEVKQRIANGESILDQECELCPRPAAAFLKGETPLCAGCFGEVLRL